MAIKVTFGCANKYEAFGCRKLGESSLEAARYSSKHRFFGSFNHNNFDGK